MAHSVPSEREPTNARDAVVTKALLRAADALGLSQKELARTVGVSEATISRISRPRAERGVPPTLVATARKEGELALLLLRVFRSLDALLGGDAQKVRAWFAAENAHLGGIPKERVQTAEGLVTVALYLDAMRGNL
jgi:transcriptional regulator with XRE-family HTH domain